MFSFLRPAGELTRRLRAAGLVDARGAITDRLAALRALNALLLSPADPSALPPVATPGGGIDPASVVPAAPHGLGLRVSFCPMHFHDMRNSFLSQVLTRKLGIPITLALLHMTVGRRAGAFPGLASLATRCEVCSRESSSHRW